MLRTIPGKLIALLLAAALPFTGCVSSGYRAARKNTPAPQLLNIKFPPGRFDATLISVITWNGPGSWKRDAFWDEYVVTIQNTGSDPMTIGAAGLIDSAGSVRAAGVAPWALEQESKRLEDKYRAAGIAFVRYTTPGLAIVGTGAAAVASAGLFTSAASTAATATVVALPLYYITVLTINHSNKRSMENEFRQRRLVTPLTLAPGESRTASLFFPMVPAPRSLTLQWSDRSNAGDAALELTFLRDLHIKAPGPSGMAHSNSQ